MDLSRLFSQLIRIEGLNIWEGLSHVGGREVYTGTLRIFCGELEKKIEEIREFLTGENWKDYTIAVHAVKGALAGVGAWELAGKSLELEDGSRRKDYAFCRKHTAEILAGMVELTASLRGTVLFEADTRPREGIEASLLEEKLRMLHHACGSGESGAAEALARELKTKTCSKEIDSFIDTLCAHVESLDYDLAIRVIETALEQLHILAGTTGQRDLSLVS